jgi:hypothetical protein
MVRKITSFSRNVVANPRKLNKEKISSKTELTKRRSYLSSNNCIPQKLQLSGPTRMKKFLRSCLISLNQGDNFYTAETKNSEKLYLPVAKGITKISLAANFEFQKLLERTAKTYIGQAGVLTKASGHKKNITAAHFQVVDKFFVNA